MFAHVYGKSINMEELDQYRVIVGDDTDYIITKEEVDRYEFCSDVLIKKEILIPSLQDASRFSLHINTYVERYPERHHHHNYLNQEYPAFRRTSST